MDRNEYWKKASQMKDFGLDLNTEPLLVKIPNAVQVLRELLAERIGNVNWLPEYDKVAEWMSDSNGKGLLLKGNVGRGKTEIGRNILPVVIWEYCNVVVSCYDAYDLYTKRGEFVDSRRPLCIDDLGTEDARSKGVFEQLADQMEKRSRFLIITTNLKSEEIKAAYGDRVYDRLKGCMKSVTFTGESMRGARL